LGGIFFGPINFVPVLCVCGFFGPPPPSPPPPRPSSFAVPTL